MKKLAFRRVKCFTEAHTTWYIFWTGFLVILNKDYFQLYNSNSNVYLGIEILSNCLSNLSIWTHHNDFPLNMSQNKLVIIL